VQSTRLADPFEPLNSSLAQSAEELRRYHNLAHGKSQVFSGPAAVFNGATEAKIDLGKSEL